MKKTLIEIIIGIIIIVIGVFYLADSFTEKTFEVNDTVAPNSSKSYTLYARSHTTQFMNITGNMFDLSLSTPKDGLQIPTTTHTNPIDLSWVHLDDGVSSVIIQNIDDSDLEIDAILTTNTDVSMIKYFIIMIIIGAVILGLSILKIKQSTV